MFEIGKFTAVEVQPIDASALRPHPDRIILGHDGTYDRTIQLAVSLPVGEKRLFAIAIYKIKTSRISAEPQIALQILFYFPDGRRDQMLILAIPVVQQGIGPRLPVYQINASLSRYPSPVQTVYQDRLRGHMPIIDIEEIVTCDLPAALLIQDMQTEFLGEDVQFIPTARHVHDVMQRRGGGGKCRHAVAVVLVNHAVRGPDIDIPVIESRRE